MKTSKTAAKERITMSKSRGSLLIPAIFIVLISFVVYFNALFNGFVYDDADQVLKNPWIRDLRHIPDMFSKSVWSFLAVPSTSNHYRPVMHIIYMINYHTFGLVPWGFHLVNILFHSGVSVMVFLLASRLLGRPEKGGSTPLLSDEPSAVRHSLFTFHDSRSFAFIAALLFAVHPIHTEAVAWIAAITDLSYTFFYLLALYFYIRARTDMHKYAHLFSLISFSLSLLCKEPAVTLPIVLIAYDIAFGKKGEHFVTLVKRYLPYFVILGIYFIVRYHALGSLAPVKEHRALTTYQYIVNVFPLFARYIEKLLFPIELSAFYTLQPIASVFEMKGIVSFVVTTAYLALSITAYRKNRTAFFGLALIAVPLLPVLYIPGLGEASLAERYLYLPSAGFVLLLALSLMWLREKTPRYGIVIVVCALSVAVLYSIQTIGRNPVWKDNLIFFTDTVNRSPDAELPRGMLGNALVDAGRIDEAIEQYRLLLELHPNSVEAHVNLGFALAKKGMVREAVPEYQRALAISPDNVQARYNLATSYEKLRLTDEAIEQYRLLTGLAPNSAEAYLNLGLAYTKKGLMKEAIAEYEKAVRIDPGYVEAHYNMGSAYANLGHLDEAIEHFKTAVRLRPDNAFYHNILGITYGQRGLFDEAIGEFTLAVRLAPAEPAYRKNQEKAQGMKAERQKKAVK